MNRVPISSILNSLSDAKIQFRFIGDKEIVLSFPSAIEDASTGTLSFYRGNIFSEVITSLRADNCMLLRDIVMPGKVQGNLIICDDPDFGFCIAAKHFEDSRIADIHSSSVISKEAVIGNNVTIGPFCVLEDSVEIGNNVRIGSNVHLRQCVIKEEVTIGSNVSVGAESLGYQSDSEGNYIRRPFFKKVLIERKSYIHDGAVLCRGFLEDTRIGENNVIGECAIVGSTVQLGRSCLVAPRVFIAGSVKIGQKSQLWGGVTVRDGVKIGNNVTVGLGSIVTKNIPDNEVWVGSPAKYYKHKK